jgi:hypothetical protein
MLVRRLLILTLLSLAPGCVSSRTDPHDGPRRPAPVRSEPWSFQGAPGKKLLTPHYLIYTTLGDDEVLSNLAQLMEGALSQYHRLAPGVELTGQPMACYLFQTRDQWAAFTSGRTGADAAIYLQINRGGYTVRDWYVAYFLGDLSTYSVAAHEGFHQYVARHFRSRLPPFLEEGLACMFEEVRWETVRGRGILPRWNFVANGSRLTGLRNAVEGGYLVPLPQLVSMHAGQVVDRSPEQIEAFYAQSWAFGRFLWDAEGGRYRQPLRRLLTDAADGTLFPGETTRRTSDGLWDPDSARPLLEHYLAAPLETLDAAFRRYVLKLMSDHRPPPEG